MDLSLFDYHLPENQIAQFPVQNRDQSRLLVVHREKQTLEETIFQNIPNFLSPGDALVLNDTYVIPARLLGKKMPGGAAIELLLLQPFAEGEWQVIAYRATRLKKGTHIVFSNRFSCEVLERLEEGKFRVRFYWEGDWNKTLEDYGQVPLPPYISRKNGEFSTLDKERYQTVFARRTSPHESVAAPTAGLHFTPNLLERCRRNNIKLCSVTLRIGLDTFLPLRVEKIEDHRMHSELYVVTKESAEILKETRNQGKKIVAVGTTVVRVLESAASSEHELTPGEGQTTLYIYPGYRFKMVDSLITNFHLPRSSLLLLVSAFMGDTLRRQAYEYAIQNQFRFYSYGDSMLIL